MKLLYCTLCRDIFSLAHTIRTCRCGLCKGKYHEDGHTAVVNGKGISLGINNNHLRAAIAKMLITGFVTSQDIECWARPHDGKLNPNTEVQEDL